MSSTGPCFLDREGHLWCYQEQHIPNWLRPDARELHRVEGVPPLRILRSSRNTFCGIDMDGGLHCSNGSNFAALETPGPAQDLRRDHVRLEDGSWHKILERSVEHVPGLDGVDRIFGSATDRCSVVHTRSGWQLLDGSEGPWLNGENQSSIPLSSLDTKSDVVDVQLVGLGRGCALHEDGGVSCWHHDGTPTRAHRADGQGRALGWADLKRKMVFSDVWCVATDTNVWCDNPTRSEPAFEISMQADAFSTEGTLCALTGDRVACLDQELHDVWPVRVEVGRAVKRVNSNWAGACATTDAGELVCWGQPFGASSPAVDGSLPRGTGSTTPFPGPTRLIDEGVLDFELGTESWCLTTGSGTRCFGESFPEGIVPKGTVVDVSMFGICGLDNGRVRCELRDRALRPQVAAALSKPGVTLLEGSVHDEGCVARGEKVTCWDDEDGRRVAKAPGPVAQVLFMDDQIVLRLEDGRVARRHAEGGPSEVLDLANVEELAPSSWRGRWCARIGRRWVCDADGQRTEQLVPPLREPRCWVSESDVYCIGSRQRGITGQPWSRGKMTLLPAERE